MYRKYTQCRACGCNNMNSNQQDLIDDTCDYVQNTMALQEDNCECGFDEEDNVFPTNPMFAQSYVPWQTMDRTFLPSVGLKMGTIFPELVSPYMPGQSMEEIEFIRNANIIGKGCNK